MYNRIKTLLALMLLMFAFTANAQLQKRPISEFTYNVKAASEELTESWWGYFDDDYNSVSVTGIGSSATLPISYSCAIRVKAGNPEVIGKRIKAMKMAFERVDFIEDVKVWMSTNLPKNPEDADICCVSLDKSSILTLESDNDVNKISFPEPYQIRNEDVYIGYSFKVTSTESDYCTYPIVVSYSSTMENAFLLNWGDGWRDMAGNNYGNLAIMLLLDDGGEFEIGDANYDLDVNVLDVTYTLEYILKGNVAPFNKRGADVDGNGEINIVDVESIIDMILERYKAPADKKAAESNDALIVERTADGMNVSLVADNSYRGFQMDIVLPEGADMNSIAADKNISATHDVRYTEIADGRYRVVASSVNGSELSVNAKSLFSIMADTYDIKIENIVFATTELQEKRFNNISMSDVNGIENITFAEGTEDIYNVYGVRVNGSKHNLAKGVYIVNGKKVIIK